MILTFSNSFISKRYVHGLHGGGDEDGVKKSLDLIIFYVEEIERAAEYANSFGEKKGRVVGMVGLFEMKDIKREVGIVIHFFDGKLAFMQNMLGVECSEDGDCPDALPVPGSDQRFIQELNDELKYCLKVLDIFLLDCAITEDVSSIFS
jgi:hypothetical protein